MLPILRMVQSNRRSKGVVKNLIIVVLAAAAAYAFLSHNKKVKFEVEIEPKESATA